MQTLLIATGNAGKLREFREMLAPLGCDVQSAAEAGFALEVEENGATFAENAALKARALCRLTDCAALGDDSGLCVEALGGAPGVHTARYAGERATDAQNIAKLLAALQSVPEKERKAHFACAIVCAFPDGRELLAEGRCPGRIAFAPRGEGGFGYDPVFLVEDGRSFAELSADEKNRQSHRGRALRRLLELLEER